MLISNHRLSTLDFISFLSSCLSQPHKGSRPLQRLPHYPTLRFPAFRRPIPLRPGTTLGCCWYYHYGSDWYIGAELAWLGALSRSVIDTTCPHIMISQSPLIQPKPPLQSSCPPLSLLAVFTSPRSSSTMTTTHSTLPVSRSMRYGWRSEGWPG